MNSKGFFFIKNDECLKPVFDENGKLIGFTQGGADTVIPFNKGGKGIINITAGFNAAYGSSYGYGKVTCDITIDFENQTATVSNLNFQIHDPGPLWLYAPICNVNIVNSIA